MRDINRIRKFCNELADIWESQCPDWRFSQLMFNIFERGEMKNVDTFYWEDDKTMKFIKSWFNISESTLEEAFKDKMFVITDESGEVKMACVPYREGYVEHVKSGALYDVFRYTCCGYEHAESRTDSGASEIPMNWCPNCGAKIVEKEE